MTLVDVSTDRSVRTITLSDVARRNALSRDMLDALLGAVGAADSDPNVRVVVVTNQGPVFCAGADLKGVTSKSGAPSSPRGLAELFQRIRHSPKPYVGRLAGHCVAGGVGLAAVMDVSVALDSAHFGFTEVRLGVAPAVISVVCLEKMRPGDARELFLRGERFSALRAAQLGLITRAESSERFDAVVEDVVNDLLAGEPNALALAKRLTYVVPTMGESEAFRETTRWSAELFASESAAQGIAAALSKQRAPWVETYGGAKSSIEDER